MPSDPGLLWLDRRRLRELLGELDAALPPATDRIEVVVVGGAAFALRWNLRSTIDVDLISDRVPQSLRIAAAHVAQRHELDADWLNDAAKGFVPAMDASPSLVFDGDRLAVYAASDRFLLAMKLFAARGDDLPDCASWPTQRGSPRPTSCSSWSSPRMSLGRSHPKVQYFAHEVIEQQRQLPNLRTRPQRDPPGLGR